MKLILTLITALLVTTQAHATANDSYTGWVTYDFTLPVGQQVFLNTPALGNPDRKERIYLRGYIIEDTHQDNFKNAIIFNGFKVYAGDYVKMTGNSFSDRYLYALKDISNVEIIAANPRLECHSLLKNSQNSFYYVNSPTHNSKDDDARVGVGFLRVDTCYLKDGVVCSNTWGTIDYFTQSNKVQIDESLPLIIQREAPLEGYLLDSGFAESAIVKKYGQEEYRKNILGGKSFNMILTTDSNYADLPADSAASSYRIEERAVENRGRNVSSNAHLSWGYKLGALKVTGDIPLYCYRWE